MDKVVRRAVDVARNLTRAVEELRHRRGKVGCRQRRMRAESLDIDAQERKFLTQVVVKIAGKAVPFRFLRGNQPTGEMLGIRATRTERRLSGPARILRSPPFRTLDEQRRNERRLRGTHSDGSDHMGLIFNRPGPASAAFPRHVAACRAVVAIDSAPEWLPQIGSRRAL